MKKGKSDIHHYTCISFEKCARSVEGASSNVCMYLVWDVKCEHPDGPLDKRDARIEDLEGQLHNAAERVDKKDREILRMQTEMEHLRKTYQETVNRYLSAQAELDALCIWWGKYGEEEDSELGKIYHIPTPEEMEELAKTLKMCRLNG